ncbi:TMEM165/GDT1 family protein [Marichromatium bheemlicum]|nr:TMEM165/GDT1 family protein [Marichromatium bheemlicum]
MISTDGGAIAATFALVALAEMGDKSQLVCMALAARHRHWPVLLGALAAFLLLNTLAVLFGAALTQWIPDQLLAAAVAVLFAVFGIVALRTNEAEDEGDTQQVQRSGHSILVATFLLLFLAEMGDKTQLAVAGMATTLAPLPVWIGANLAMALTAALGVFVGCRLLTRLPIVLVHRISGALFLVLAVVAATQVF